MTEWRQMTTQERIALVKQHHTREGSALKIAASIGMGVTRNAVIGLYERNRDMKLSHPLGGGHGGKRSPPKSEAPVTRREPKFKTIIHKREIVPQPKSPVRISRPEFRHVDLMELRSGECKWPLGDRPFLFCGAPAEGSYCAYHRRLSYAPPRERIAR